MAENRLVAPANTIGANAPHAPTSCRELSDQRDTNTESVEGFRLDLLSAWSDSSRLSRLPTKHPTMLDNAMIRTWMTRRTRGIDPLACPTLEIRDKRELRARQLIQADREL